MIDTVVAMLSVATGFYLAGDMARRNPRIDAFVRELESGYGSLNKWLKNTKIRDGLIFIRKMYGWSAILFFSLANLVGTNSNSKEKLGGSFGHWLFVVSTVSFIGWLCILWCTKYSSVYPHIRINRPADLLRIILLLIFLSPSCVFILDIVQGVNPGEPEARFYRIINSLERAVQQSNSFMEIRLVGFLLSMIVVFVSVAILAIVAISNFYLIAWILSIVVTGGTLIIIAGPVFLARFIHSLNPANAFTGLVLLVFAVTVLFQAWR